MLTPEIQAEVLIRRFREHHSARKIAKDLGINRTSVCIIIKRRSVSERIQYTKRVSILDDTDEPWNSSELVTDEQGRLALQLVPGAYLLNITWESGRDTKPGDKSPYRNARFDWTARGPANSVVKIARNP